MADELSYDDAVALLLREFGGTGGHAEWCLLRAVERGGVRARLSGANGVARRFSSQNIKYKGRDLGEWEYDARDLAEWTGQERRRLKRIEERERIEARDAEPTGHLQIDAHGRSKAKSGRNPKWDWAAIGAFVAEQIDHHGNLAADNPNWKCIADLERAVQQQFRDSDGNGPAHGTLQPILRGMVTIWTVRSKRR